MSDSTRRVSVRIALEGGRQVEVSLREVGDAGQREMQKIVQGAEGASRALRLLGPIVAGLSFAGVGASLAAFTRNALDTVGGLGELAEQAGVSTEALQVLNFAAIDAGTSAEEVQRALAALTRLISDAASGERAAAERFERLGIRFRDAAGNARNTEAVFADLADVVARFESPAERAAAATSLLSDRLGQRLIPLLAQGRDGLEETAERARRMGAVLDADLSEKADRASASIAELTTALTRMAQGLAVSVAPAITATAQALNRLIFGATSAERSLEIGQRVVALGREIAALEAGGADPSLLGAFQTPAERAATNAGRIEALRAEQARLIEESARLAREYEERQRRIVEGGGVFGERVTAGAGEAEQRRRRAAADIAQLEQQLDARVRIEAQFQQQLARIREAEQAGAIDAATAQRLVARATDERAEALRRLTTASQRAARSTNEETAEGRELIEVLREQERLIQQNETAYERFQRRIESLDTLIERSRRVGVPLSEEVINREISAALDELERAEERTRQVSDTARDLGLAFSSAFEDAIVNGRRFSEVLRGLEQDLLRLGTRKLLTEPLLSLFSNLIGGQGSGGDVFSRLLAGISGGGGGGLFSGIGNIFSSIFGSIFHEGGMVGGPAGARAVPALAFAGAPRFHSGGFPGLRPGEVPAILQRGERVLSRDEVRRGSGGGQVNVTIVAPSPETFHASRSLIEARMAQAVRMGARNL
jgi:hypothetical protein